MNVGFGETFWFYFNLMVYCTSCISQLAQSLTSAGTNPRGNLGSSNHTDFINTFYISQKSTSALFMTASHLGRFTVCASSWFWITKVLTMSGRKKTKKSSVAPKDKFVNLNRHVACFYRSLQLFHGTCQPNGMNRQLWSNEYGMYDFAFSFPNTRRPAVGDYELHSSVFAVNLRRSGT